MNSQDMARIACSMAAQVAPRIEKGQERREQIRGRALTAAVSLPENIADRHGIGGEIDVRSAPSRSNVSGVIAADSGNNRSRIDQPSCSNANPSAAMVSFLRSNAIRIAPTSRKPGKIRRRNRRSRLLSFAGHLVLPILSGDFLVTRFHSIRRSAFDSRQQFHSGTTQVRIWAWPCGDDLALADASAGSNTVWPNSTRVWFRAVPHVERSGQGHQDRESIGSSHRRRLLEVESLQSEISRS